ncbi:hypothetical protein LIER_06293 [Lithospermum erythrorhizon]|uniref:Reverse transcriptase RNase H-like domain-containing protein n=1 Tax=Lithospermum erythrorhizon TaxID=34254 RepID=A0AAV3P3S5_LITER
MLARPVTGATLQLNLSMSEHALSIVLIKEEDKVQRPIYNVSRVMRGGKKRYPLTEKLVFALIVAARKLKPYFEAHRVEVVKDQPLRHILENPSRSVLIVKWVIDLREFILRYKPRTSIKAQTLANFMVGFTHGLEEESPEFIDLIEASQEKGSKIEYTLRFTFTATNNEAWYEALANGLTLANALGAEHIHIRTILSCWLAT